MEHSVSMQPYDKSGRFKATKANVMLCLKN